MITPVLSIAVALATVVIVVLAVRLRRCAATTALAEEETRSRITALEQLVHRNETILRHAIDGFFVLDEDCRFVETNEAFARMLGYSQPELATMRMSDLEVPDPQQSLLGIAGMRTGLHHIPTAHRHKDGHLVHLESSIVVLRHGTRKLLAGFSRDVTDRLRANEALRRSEEQYRHVVETSRDLIWAVDAEGRWKFVNEAAREIYGYDPAAMIGRPFVDSVADGFVAIDRDGFERLKTGDQRYVEFDTCHVRRDGSPVHLMFHAIVVRDPQGRLVELTGTARDVTEQRRAAEALRTAHERLASLTERMPLGFLVWTPEGEIKESNPAALALFGDRASRPQANVLGLLDEKSRAAFRRMWSALLNGTQHNTLRLDCTRPDGESFGCEWFNTVLYDGESNLQLVASILRDVSERERYEARLNEAQRLESLGVLAGGVAHDFNNLLVGILGNASLAIEMVNGNGVVRGYLQNIVKATGRATDLTRQMLAYAGRAERNIEMVDCNALLDDVSELMRAAIPKSVTLDVELESGLPLIEADSAQIQQVLMNLLMNAAEAIGDKPGTVRIQTRDAKLDADDIAREFADTDLRPGEMVLIEVSDDGCGMSPETQQRIFEPFFTTKFTGRGLGLSAIRGIIQAHHGAIRVRSREGVGTRFSVLFPAVACATNAPETPAAAPCAELDATILIVDDEADVREVVEAILTSRGARVLTASDGNEGVMRFRQHADEIDIVLLDLTMPGMGGDEVFRAITEIRPDVRVIICSGYSEKETLSRFREGGLTGFVNKPYTVDALLGAVGAALTKHA